MISSSLSGVQGVDAAAGEQGGDDLEGRIFGGRADEADGAVLDVGQEGVLLGFVEAMDLVDEEDGARAEVRAFSASTMTCLISLMPERTAENWMKVARVVSAMILARVVLPTPGGPQKIMEAVSSRSICTRSGLPGASRCCWPTNSSRRAGAHALGERGGDWRGWPGRGS